MALAAGALSAAAWAGMAMGHAEPPSRTGTVDGVDYPYCYVEDGSDAASLPCIWVDPDTGTAYLTFSDYSIGVAK